MARAIDRRQQLPMDHFVIALGRFETRHQARIQPAKARKVVGVLDLMMPLQVAQVIAQLRGEVAFKLGAAPVTLAKAPSNP